MMEKDEQEKLKMKTIWLHFVISRAVHLHLVRLVEILTSKSEIGGLRLNRVKTMRVMELQTHLSSRERFGILIQLINM